jgi:Ni,Fe-hydrogenase III large subunit
LASVVAHDDVEHLRVVYVFTCGPPDVRRELVVHLNHDHPTIPTLSDLSFTASRFERELHDTFAIVPLEHPFLRPLVRHQHWSNDWYPLRRGAGPMPAPRDDAAPYPFIEVQGSGVYEIPVGPVHAGLIEPGHFRFTVVGETILKMTARLWFVHRGIERMFQGVDSEMGLLIAERISGDTAVGHSLAYCLALEEAQGLSVADEACTLRAILLELERLYNHVGDIGALCGDVSFGVAEARASVLRERLLRVNEKVAGHRLLRGAIRVGATRVLNLPDEHELRAIEEQFDDLVQLATSHSVVVDRFEGTAVLSATDARAIGTLGVVARSSGVATDARVTSPFFETSTSLQPMVQRRGDVLARFDQRVDEVHASFALLHTLATASNVHSNETQTEFLGSGLGLVEGWRGTIVHRFEIERSGSISRGRVVDPSFHNWPALSIALANTIVPDFPLANKSFNLSYAGNDL